MTHEARLRSIASELSRMCVATLHLIAESGNPVIEVIDQPPERRVNVGGRSFEESLAPEEFVEWIFTIHKLTSMALIRKTGAESYRITRLGLSVAGYLEKQ